MRKGEKRERKVCMLESCGIYFPVDNSGITGGVIASVGHHKDEKSGDNFNYHF